MGDAQRLTLVFIASYLCPDSGDLGAYLTQQDDILVVGQARCLAELLGSIRHARPDIVLLDVPAPDVGVDVVSKILQDVPETRVLIRCGREPCETDTISVVSQRGVWGCLSTADPHTRCLNAIRAVQAGQIWATRDALSQLVRRFVDTASPQRQPPKLSCALTEREREIVDALARGMTNKEIGKRLGISDKTVKTHLKNIFGKLGIHRRVNLLRQFPDLQVEGR
jgi:DNA-binding NarL/FixJ family response regulator